MGISTLTSLFLIDGKVGSYCNNDSDCSGQLLLPDSSIISTTRCTDNKCECNAPKYTVVGYTPEYRCHIKNGDDFDCKYDLECEFTCNLNGKYVYFRRKNKFFPKQLPDLGKS
ncbi:hypothetical protein BpHYR1_045220 [Brachionus plicatilis]|uniref:Uncharacterized protein n=1 Tax=Brachionus plicatilis TaxID=10195 RepID=A0A3M7PXZ7_BRAPC|nr:hypothetical protein BpHYR1_045220 [Brachionus plicatilis]